MFRCFPWAISLFIAAPLVLIACGDDDGGSEDSTDGGVGGGGRGGSGGASARGGGGNGGSRAGRGGNEAMAGTGGAGTAGSAAGGVAGTGTVAGSGGTAGALSGGTNGNAGTTAGGSGNASAGEGGVGATGGTLEGGSGGAPEAGSGGVPEAGSGGWSGSGGVDGGEGGSGGSPTIEADVLDNPGFEADGGWTITSTPAGAAWLRHGRAEGAKSGTSYLDMWRAEAYTVTVSQVVSPLPNGTYTFKIWCTGSVFTKQQLFARGHDAQNPSAELPPHPIPSNSSYELVTFASIPVTSGSLEIGIYSEAPAGAWANCDDAELTLTPP